MSDRMKRFWCRTLFVLICVVPTAVVIHWILTPPTNIQWENAIKRQLGLVTTVGHVETPLPQETILGDVRIQDAERRHPIPLGTVTIANTEEGRRIQVQALKIKNGALSQLLRRVFTELSEPPYPTRPYKIQFGTTQVHSVDWEGNPLHQELHQTVAEVIPSSKSRIDLVIRFHLDPPTVESAKPIQINYIRRLDETPAEVWHVDTHSVKLPLWLVADMVPEMRCLGDQATFHGQIRLEREKLDWSGSLNGVVRNIDLFQLIRPLDKWWMNGRAELAIDHCQLFNNKIESMQGHFSSPRGEIDRQLVASLANQLNLQIPELASTQAQQEVLEFSQAEFSFEIRDGVLTIRGDRVGNLLFTSDKSKSLLRIDQQNAFTTTEFLLALGGETPTAIPLSTWRLSQLLNIPRSELDPTSSLSPIGESYIGRTPDSESRLY